MGVLALLMTAAFDCYVDKRAHFISDVSLTAPDGSKSLGDIGVGDVVHVIARYTSSEQRFSHNVRLAICLPEGLEYVDGTAMVRRIWRGGAETSFVPDPAEVLSRGVEVGSCGPHETACVEVDALVTDAAAAHAMPRGEVEEVQGEEDERVLVVGSKVSARGNAYDWPMEIGCYDLVVL